MLMNGTGNKDTFKVTILNLQNKRLQEAVYDTLDFQEILPKINIPAFSSLQQKQVLL